jgi:hypothetical protein
MIRRLGLGMVQQTARHENDASTIDVADTANAISSDKTFMAAGWRKIFKKWVPRHSVNGSVVVINSKLESRCSK